MIRQAGHALGPILWVLLLSACGDSDPGQDDRELDAEVATGTDGAAADGGLGTPKRDGGAGGGVGPDSGRAPEPGDRGPEDDAAIPLCETGESRERPCGPHDAGTRTDTCEGGVFRLGECNLGVDCEADESPVVPCGLNGRGEERFVCMEGALQSTGCNDPDACEDGHGLRQACGPNGRGERLRFCEEGIWGPEGPCVGDEDECVDESVQAVACGLNGRGRQRQQCDAGRWVLDGDCVDLDVCTDGATRQSTCGLNHRGQLQQRCTLGVWADDGDCVDSDVCTDGESGTAACGPNRRGTQPVDCDFGQWAAAAPCDGAGACVDGALATEPCGLNGGGIRQLRCDEGTWTPLACQDADVCSSGSAEVRSCGLNDRGTQVWRCEGGQWAADACNDWDQCRIGNIDTSRSCGLNGRGQGTYECRDGYAYVEVACDDPDECRDGSTRYDTCGLNGRGRAMSRCEQGQWGPWECTDRDECVFDAVDTQTCGATGAGVKSRTCVDGAWGVFDECSTCEDFDGDRFGVDCNAGPDCDDTDSRVNPNRADLPYNGKDDDCAAQPVVPELTRMKGVGIGGAVFGFTRANGYAFVGQGRSLRISRVDTIENTLAQVDLGAPVRAIEVVGNHAVVLAGPRLVVLDVSDAMSPRVISERYVADVEMRELLVQWPNVYLTGDYYSSSYGSLRRAKLVEQWSLEDPSAPQRIAGLWHPSDDHVPGLHMAEGKLVWATTRSVNVSEPGSLDTTTWSTPLDEGHEIQGFMVEGQSIYVLDQLRLVRLDLQDLSAAAEVVWGPREFPSYPSTGNLVRTTEGRLFFVRSALVEELLTSPAGTDSQTTTFSWSGGRTKLLADNDGLLLANESRGIAELMLSGPVPSLQPLHEPLTYVEAIALEGDYAYLVGGAFGIAVVDVRDPESPRLLGRAALPGEGSDVQVLDGYAYVVSARALTIVDATDPALPVVGQTVLDAVWSTSPELTLYATGSGTTRRVFAYVSNGGYGIASIEVTNPDAPVTRQGASLYGEAHGLAVDGDRLFTAYHSWQDESGGLAVHASWTDAAPTASRHTSFGEARESAAGVGIHGRTAYVFSGRGCKLHAFDVGYYGVNTVELESSAYCTGYIFSRASMTPIDRKLVGAADGLFVFDISVPTQPDYLGGILDARAADVHEKNGRLLVGSALYGLDIYRID